MQCWISWRSSFHKPSPCGSLGWLEQCHQRENIAGDVLNFQPATQLISQGHHSLFRWRHIYTTLKTSAISPPMTSRYRSKLGPTLRLHPEHDKPRQVPSKIVFPEAKSRPIHQRRTESHQSWPKIIRLSDFSRNGSTRSFFLDILNSRQPVPKTV